MNELDPRIRIRAPLRCDGIGRLDCAEDTVSGERLAVRWLPLDANGDAAVKACEKLPAHPTLPRILQTGQVGGSAFVALDFPQGELLSARGEEPLDPEQVLKLAAQLADALATVHAQGMVHGEMSRDSVLVTDDGRAFLWDMPLVIANRLSDRRGENRLMQNLVKTAPYLAPERARGDGASQASDVYALGAILCVAGGAALPSADTTLAVVHQVAAGGWQPRVPMLPQPWQGVVEKMISLDAAQRPTAAQVAEAFARVPNQNMLPTVPEMPAVRLPPEILEAAQALMKSQVEALRRTPHEVPVTRTLETEAVLVTAETLAAESARELVPSAETATPVEAIPSAAPAFEPVASAGEPLLPLASDPVPELTLNAPRMVQAHTLDDLGDVQHDVVRIPTLELKAIELESNPAVPVQPAPVADVALTDNVSVSPELAAAGAAALSEEELRAMRVSPRKVVLLFGSIALAAFALVATLVSFASSGGAPSATPTAAPVVETAPVVERAQPRVDRDELVPLPNLQRAAPKKVDTVAPVAPTATPAASSTAETTEETPAVSAQVEAAPSEPASPAADMKAIDQAFDAPLPATAPNASELKRPSAEL